MVKIILAVLLKRASYQNLFKVLLMEALEKPWLGLFGKVGWG